MSTLDDKLLGEKLHYYCSSSEDEEEGPTLVKEEDVIRMGGGDVGYNTGPKGVIQDWQRYKQLEREQREGQAEELKALAKKLTLSCRTDREDQEAKAREQKLEEEFEAMLDDEGAFLKDYMKKRMEEMIEANMSTRSRFGDVVDLLSHDDYLIAIDQEEKNVLVLILVYEQGAPGCDAAHGCLVNLAKVYDHVKFCRMLASTAGLSKLFKDSGVPAILSYKAGEQLSSLIRITDALSEDFFAEDLQAFLVENGVLHDKSLLPSKIRGPAAAATQADDSD